MAIAWDPSQAPAKGGPVPVQMQYPAQAAGSYNYSNLPAPSLNAIIDQTGPLAKGAFEVDVWIGYGATPGNGDDMIVTYAPSVSAILLIEPVANATRGPFRFIVISDGTNVVKVQAGAVGPVGSLYRALILGRRLA